MITENLKVGAMSYFKIFIVPVTDPPLAAMNLCESRTIILSSLVCWHWSFDIAIWLGSRAFIFRFPSSSHSRFVVSDQDCGLCLSEIAVSFSSESWFEMGSAGKARRWVQICVCFRGKEERSRDCTERNKGKELGR